MDTAKVKELIADLEADIKLKQEALQGLKKLVSSDGGTAARSPLFTASDSYVDLAVKVINANDNRPLRMNEIVSRIRILKGNPDIQRRSVESTLIQHVRTKREMSRVLKVRPGVWGVRRFPRLELLQEGDTAEGSGGFEGMNHTEALVRIAKANGRNRVTIKEAKKVFIAAGLSKSKRYLASILYGTLNRSDKFRKVAPGEYELIPQPVEKGA